MDERELAAELPAPRDDDPPSLRQDILDELADHLHCAMTRELLRGADRETARDRVIKRFGNPADVARRLWLQATWRKIMIQRLMIGAIAVLGILCVTLALGIGWTIRQQSLVAAEQQRTMAEMMRRVTELAERTNQSMSVQPNSEPSVSSILIRLTLDAPDGPPAEGFTSTLAQLGFDRGKSMSEQTDANGSADFGYCEPGRYEITIQTPWGFLSAPKRFLLRPGTAHVEAIVCPAKPDEIEVAFATNMPDDLLDAGVSAIVSFQYGSYSVGGESWKEHDVGGRFVQIDQGGWRFCGVSGDGFSGFASRAQTKWRAAIDRDRSEVHVMAGVRYAVRGIRLVIPTVVSVPPEMANRVPSPQRLSPMFDQVAPQPPRRAEAGVGHETLAWYQLDREFVPVAGQRNQWEIAIPDELIEQARDYVKENPPLQANGR